MEIKHDKKTQVAPEISPEQQQSTEQDLPAEVAHLSPGEREALLKEAGAIGAGALRAKLEKQEGEA